MPSIDLVVETEISRTARARQLEAMFDVPPAEKCRLSWSGDLPIESEDWHVGLIVGPSGSGKSSIARHVFGPDYHPKLEWGGKSVIDDFRADLGMDEVSKACEAVGFNTIPAWLRPFSVLSNGEKFRVDVARRILEMTDPIVVDEFTSVVDRQVAQIGSHAIQKWIRRKQRRFVAISCHFDIVDWLQPDWIFEPGTMHFARRALCPRPNLNIVISRIHRSAWALFAPFHYMSSELCKSARCFGLWCQGRLAAFAGIMPKPISTGKDRGTAIAGVSRVVTLPDWQGLGLAFVLLDKLGAAYTALGIRFRNYPAHPSFVRAHDRSTSWCLAKSPGRYSVVNHKTGWGGRACAVFEYRGPAMERRQAEMLIADGRSVAH